MDPGIQKSLDEGIAALRIGNNEEARRKLMQVINADERNESAWFYLSEVVESDEDRLICLENVLAINPANFRAETELRALQERLAEPDAEGEGLVCPSCGATNPPGSQRCLTCYTALDQVASAESAMSAEASGAGAVAGEVAPREVKHKTFMEMLDTWAEVLGLPGQDRLDEEHVYARWGLTVLSILISSGITYFFVLLVGVGAAMVAPTMLGAASLMPTADMFDPVQLLPMACFGVVGGAVGGLISFMLNSGIYYLVARIFGGRGDFTVQSYLLSLVYSPFSLVVGIVSPLFLLMVLNPILGIIPGLILAIVSILALIMWVRALKSAHGYGTGAALGTMFLPGIIIGCLCGILPTLLGSGLSSINSLPLEGL